MLFRYNIILTHVSDITATIITSLNVSERESACLNLQWSHLESHEIAVHTHLSQCKDGLARGKFRR